MDELHFPPGVLFWIGVRDPKQMRRSAESFPTQGNWTKSIIAFESQTRYVGVHLYCLIYLTHTDKVSLTSQ